MEGAAARADLVIVQSPETFVTTRTGIQNPTLARLYGKDQSAGMAEAGNLREAVPDHESGFCSRPTRNMGLPDGQSS
jgi:hypothetical protein